MNLSNSRNNSALRNISYYVNTLEAGNWWRGFGAFLLASWEIHYGGGRLQPVGISSGSGDGDSYLAKSVRNTFKDYLDNDISKACSDALKQLGIAVSALKQAADNLRFYDVNQIAKQPGTKYFGPSAGKQTVAQVFDADAKSSNNNPATAAYSQLNGPRPGIYARGGASRFAFGDLEQSNLFLLHELTHVTGKLSDPNLAKLLGLTLGKGESASNAVSRFFNSNCTKKTK